MTTKLSILCAAALAAAIPAPLLAQAVIPVYFAPGSTQRTLTDSIQGMAYKDYRISVAAGQQLTVSLTATRGSPYFNVLEPASNGEAIYNSSMGDQRYTGVTRRSGNYTIRVYQMRATGRRGEIARFQLQIGAVGGTATQLPGHAGGAATQLPGDALVAGTNYHATADVRCRSMAGAAMGTCKAGVIRRRGTATVHLDTPDGGERTILFRGTTAVSSDSRAGLYATKRGDTSVVRIGTVEVYEIPDVLIEGG